MDKNLEKRIEEADSLLRKKRASKAAVVVKEAIKDHPKEPYLYYLLGIARMKCGKFFLAKRALEKANELLPQNPENLRSLGWVKIMLGELEEGRNNLRDAINLDLTNYLAYIDLAMSYFNYFEFKEGFEWLERAKALAPDDPFVLKNYKTAKEIEKEFSKFSEKELKKMRKKRLSLEAQEEVRLFALKKYLENKALNEDEMKELKEELDLSGLSDKMLTYKDNIEKNLTKENILKKRRKVEKDISNLLKKSKSSFTLDDIKKVVYNEKDYGELKQIMAEFDQGQDLKEINEVLNTINDAWNYFPHKSLGGLCPMEKLLEYRSQLEE
jgi:tetratricopeptide (TPR) repeat protein